MPKIHRQSSRDTEPLVPASVLDRIAPVGFGENEGLRVLLYGDSATGKTTLSATFPGPSLWIIASGGKNPGELRSIDTPEYRKKISQVALENSAEVIDLVEHVKESRKYQTVVMDHVTGLQDLTLKEILGLEQVPTQKGWGLASQQQYGQSTLQTKELCRALLSLTCNVILIAQERVFKGGEDGIASDVIKPTVGASATPSLTGWLNPACDYILQCFKRQKQVTTEVEINGKRQKQTKKIRGVDFCIRTEPHETFITKFRIPKGRVLPECIVDPSYEKLIALIRGE